VLLAIRESDLGLDYLNNRTSLIERVTAEDQPATVLRRKPDSSIAVGLLLQKAGEVDAFVCAVSTGAVMAMDAGTALHAPDGYHANRAGAALTARVLWQTLSPLLP